MKINKIQSRGIDGAELAALETAKLYAIIITGYKHKDAPDVFKELTSVPTISQEPAIIWNVRDSHATLIVKGEKESKDAEYAKEIAEIYGRPYIESDSIKDIKEWLNRQGEELTLNVIGPSKEEDPTIYDKTKELLEILFMYFYGLTL